jgi:leucyl/phenylalanyl-tRNA--protein transferase
MKKILKKRIYTVTMDTDFKSVIMACAGLRIENRQSTWITGEMVNAYCNLHEEGYAHSIEAWADGELAGGLYGVSLGKCFFGESMFARKSNASKAAFIFLAEYLQRKEFNMIDCQVTTNHLMSLGAREISRTEFLHQLNHSLGYKTEKGTWTI